MTNNKPNVRLYWSLLTQDDWSLHIAASDQGLCYVGSLNQPYAELEAWVKARYPGSTPIRDDARLQPYTAELAEYLQGERQTFTLPHDCSGTTFQLEVWKALAQIPYGQTWTYSDVARFIDKPSAVRAVGAAIGANPALVTIPCHRVIGKSGHLTGYRGGLDMKIRLLDLEKATAASERCRSDV